jgi:cytochrome c biogenesis protein CcdA
MLAAVNPCGFAMLPAYLSMLVADGDAPAGRTPGVRRALLSTAAVTAGFVAVFGVFGLLLAPLAGRLQPGLPWLTVALGAGLALAGGWLLLGRSPSLPGARVVRAPRLSGSPGSMALFGVAYAVASLSCTIAPFLAIVVASLRAGSEAAALALFTAYAAGMGLVVGVTALAVTLVRTSLLRRLRRASASGARAGGALLVLAGAYIAYYGWYELRVAGDARRAGRDPVVAAAMDVRRWLVAVLDRAGPGALAGALVALLLAAGCASAWRYARQRGAVGASPRGRTGTGQVSGLSVRDAATGRPRGGE